MRVQCLVVVQRALAGKGMIMSILMGQEERVLRFSAFDIYCIKWFSTTVRSV